MCGKAVLNAPFLLKYYLSWYQTQEVCDKAVDDFLPALKFVPGWFVTSKRVRRLKNLIMFYLQTVICFSLVKILVMSGNATFCTDEMGTLNFDLNNASLNDANWDEMILKLLFMPKLWLGVIDLSNTNHLKKI